MYHDQRKCFCTISAEILAERPKLRDIRSTTVGSLSEGACIMICELNTHTRASGSMPIRVHITICSNYIGGSTVALT